VAADILALSLSGPIVPLPGLATCFEEQSGEVIEGVRGRAHGHVGYGEREGG
jgi:hypothetical protein